MSLNNIVKVNATNLGYTFVEFEPDNNGYITPR